MESTVSGSPASKPSLLWFCGRSLFREYGRAFFVEVICRHPGRTIRGLGQYAWGRSAPELTNAVQEWSGGSGSLVGVGFCLKPLAPACPAGRANHRCALFDRGVSPGHKIPAACRECRIRAFGEWARSIRSDFYIMTSAQDVLRHVLLPSLNQHRYSRALLVLCRYSFEPMRLALAIAGVDTLLMPLDRGDCRDYATWRQADLGDKTEQTEVSSWHRQWLVKGLSAAPGTPGIPSFERRDEIYEIKAGR